MPIPAATFQPFVDWCAQPKAGIFVPDLQAVLTVNGIDYVQYFYGILNYTPQIALGEFPVLKGALRAAPQFGSYDATLDIVLKPQDVTIGLVMSGGLPSLITFDLNLGPSNPPDHLNVLFADADNGINYALDLGKHWSINWRSVFHPQRAAVAHAA